MENALLTPHAGSMVRYIINFFVVWILFFSGKSIYACDLPLNWQASYGIYKYGLNVARNTTSLKSKPDNTIVYESQTLATGLLSVLKDEEIAETSLLKQSSDKSWQLMSYNRHQKNDKKRYINYKVTWLDEYVNLHGENEGEKLAFTLEAPVWDRSSSQLEIMCELFADPKTDVIVLNVVDNCKPSFHVYEKRGEETVTINKTQYKTLIFERTESRQRSTKLWLAPSLGYLPVKIEQYKDGDLNLRSQLEKLQKTL